MVQVSNEVADRSRHCKLFPLRRRLLLQMLARGQMRDGQFLHECEGVPGFASDLPPDARIEDVHYEWESDTFWVRVSHPSWPEVPDGESIPRVTCHVFHYVIDERYRRMVPDAR